jgi:hypothetical protein
MACPIIAAAAAATTPADSASHVCALPSGIAAGNLLLAVVVCRGSAAMTWPAGWTAITNGAGASGTAVRSEARYRIADGSEGASITVSGSSVSWLSRVWRITGHSGAAPTCAAASGTSANPIPPPLGDQASNALWFLSLAWDGRPGFTFWPSPYSQARLAAHVADSGGVSGWVQQASAGIELGVHGVTPGACTSASAAWRALTIAVPPAVTDEAAEAAAKIAQRAADYGV